MHKINGHDNIIICNRNMYSCKSTFFMCINVINNCKMELV